MYSTVKLICGFVVFLARKRVTKESRENTQRAVTGV